MAFKKKTWKDRMVEYAGRRKLTNISTNQSIICDVARSEGTVSQEGDALSSQNLNDLEQRIEDGFTEVKQTTDTLNQDLGGYKFSVIDGIPSYKVGADTAWVPLGSGIYYIADYGELAAYGTSPKTYTIPVPYYVKSRVAASVYNNADNYVGLADTVVGIAPGGIPGNHHHPSTLTVNDGVITITVGAKGASYYVQPRGKIYLVTGSIIKA